MYPPHRKVTFQRFPNGSTMVSIVLSMVCNGVVFPKVFAVVSIAHPIDFAMVLLRFHWFCNVFTPLSMVCNGFHCFSMVLLWSSLIFNAFAMFALLFQAFANHCATIAQPRGVYPPHKKVTFH